MWAAATSFLRYCHKNEYGSQLVKKSMYSACSDISEWPQFTEGLTSPRTLQERLSGSLMGLVVAPECSEFTVFQMDSHGDIFHQVYHDDEGRQVKDVTFSAGPGSDKLTLHPDVIGMVKKWAGLVEQQVKSPVPELEQFVMKDVTDVLEGIQTSGLLHIACPLCVPSSGNTEPHGNHGDGFCNKCTHSLEDGRNISLAVAKHGVIAPQSCHRVPEIPGVVAPSDLPSTSSLSRLLLKHWRRDPDIGDILKDREKEVSEYRKRLKKKTTPVASMSEASVLARLQGIDTPDTAEVVVSDTESITKTPGTDAPDPGFENTGWEPGINRETGLNREPGLCAEHDLDTDAGSRLSDIETVEDRSNVQGTSQDGVSVNDNKNDSDSEVAGAELDLISRAEFSMFDTQGDTTINLGCHTPTQSSTSDHSGATDAVDVDGECIRQPEFSAFSELTPVSDCGTTTPHQDKRKVASVIDGCGGSDWHSIPQHSDWPKICHRNTVNIPVSCSTITTPGSHSIKRKQMSAVFTASPHQYSSGISDTDLPITPKPLQTDRSPFKKKKESSQRRRYSSVSSNSSHTSPRSKHSIQLFSGFLSSPKLSISAGPVESDRQPEPLDTQQENQQRDRQSSPSAVLRQTSSQSDASKNSMQLLSGFLSSPKFTKKYQT